MQRNGDDMNAENIPAELSQLSRLQMLCLEYNKLTGESFGSNSE